MIVTLYTVIKSHEPDLWVSPTVRYIDVLTALVNGKSVYDVMGEDAGSHEREHVFATLAELLGCPYDDVYMVWLNAANE